MNRELSNTITDIKSLFNNYFDAIGGKDFKQFYYDWHSINMYAPFVDLVEYFKQHSNKEELKSMIKDFDAYVLAYNNDDVKNEKFSIKKYSQTKDGQLKNIMDRVDSFAFQIRQYTHAFAKPEEHNHVFGDYFGKNNMPYAHHRGLTIAKNIMQMLANNYELVDSKEMSMFAVDSYMRDKVFKSYSFKDKYDYALKTKFLTSLQTEKQKLSNLYEKELQTADTKSELTDIFQIEYADTPVYNSNKKYIPNGFELEFYYPENIGDNNQLIEVLKKKNSWHNLYTSNKDARVYNDKRSAGVIMPDESLVSHNGLNPAEYASKIMRNKADERECLKILETFDKGYVNKHCSFHQHVSAENFDLDTYKRLVKRTMQHEKDVVANFAAEERRDSRLLYATYVSNNLSKDSKADYPLLCLMVDICDNKNELVDMVSYGRKYKTLNLVPKHTVEFRYMNGHFNKEFAQGYLQFNRDFVQSAVENNGCHINRALANKYNWQQNTSSDNRTIMKDISYMYAFAFDSFNPNIKISDKVKNGDMEQARLISHALNKTGKIIVKNPVRFGREY